MHRPLCRAALLQSSLECRCDDVLRFYSTTLSTPAHLPALSVVQTPFQVTCWFCSAPQSCVEGPSTAEGSELPDSAFSCSLSRLCSYSPFFEDYKLFWMKATPYDHGHCPGKKTPEQSGSLDIIRARAWESLLRSHLSCLDMAPQTECCIEASELFTCLLSALFSQHPTTSPATPNQLSAHTEL